MIRVKVLVFHFAIGQLHLEAWSVRLPWWWGNCFVCMKKCTNKIRKNEKHANVKTTHNTTILILILYYAILYYIVYASPCGKRTKPKRMKNRDRQQRNNREKKTQQDRIMIKRFIQNSDKQIDTFCGSNCLQYFCGFFFSRWLREEKISLARKVPGIRANSRKRNQPTARHERMRKKTRSH